ncbi:MAG: hypothetical protein P8X74_19305 [Reinekea sp.]
MIRGLLLFFGSIFSFHVNAANLSSITQTDMSLESSKRVDRGTIEYVYAVTQVNSGADAENVVGTVLSTTPNVVVVNGHFSVGTIYENKSVQTPSAITLRVDRSVPFDPTTLIFSFHGDLMVADGPPGDHYIEDVSYGTLTSPSESSSFHGVGEEFVLDVTGAYFTSEAYQITVSRNGDLIEGFGLSPSQLTFSNFFVNGENHVVVYATDDLGKPMVFEETYWAGNQSVNVRVQDETGMPVVADVVLKLSDDPTVTKSIRYEGGTLTVTDLPARTIIVEAFGTTDQYGSTAFIAGSQSTTTIAVKGIASPEPSSNLDFSNGTAGWVVTGPGTISVTP